MYENFKRIIGEKGITPYRVSVETGVSQNLLSYWKSGRSTPKIDKLSKIATYLGVSIEELISTNVNEGESDGSN